MNWVVAGALAKQLLPEIEINAYVSSVGDIFCEKPYQALIFLKPKAMMYVVRMRKQQKK
jgi:chorismate synthase